MQSAEHRFWIAVNKTDNCWLWTKGKDKDGYGQFWDKQYGNIRAHRWAWQMHNGAIPLGLKVLHNCPGGDNPAHLWLGTISDNNRDTLKKGRNRWGSNCNWTRGKLNGNAKLTEEQVISIRSNCGSITQKELAKQYGVSSGLISSIVNNKSWKHLTL